MAYVIRRDGHTEGSNSAGDAQSAKPAAPGQPGENCSRTFITFTDDSTYNEIFPPSRRRIPQRHLCPITRLPAKYWDPITNTPYATLQAFRLIREAYAKQLAQESGKNSEAGSRCSTPPPSAGGSASAQKRKVGGGGVAAAAAES
jgi:vacuolar protein sorting-associated protein 72